MAREVKEQSQRLGCLDFTFTDNALPPKEADLFVQIMAAAASDNDFFFAKIRVITDGDPLPAYRRGNLSSVQVGIEARSTSLLTGMEKGTTAMDKIAAMKQSNGSCLHHRLRGNSRAIYLYCQTISDQKELALQFPTIQSQALNDFLQELSGKRLLFWEEERVLALAIPAAAR